MKDFLSSLETFMKELEEKTDKQPKDENISIVIVEPIKKPYKKMIANDLKPMQEIVNGFIEVVRLGKAQNGTELALICNEEGKLLGLPFNRKIANFDILAGTFFITAHNLAGDNVSLTEEEAEHLIKRFTPMEVYL